MFSHVSMLTLFLNLKTFFLIINFVKSTLANAIFFLEVRPTFWFCKQVCSQQNFENP